MKTKSAVKFNRTFTVLRYCVAVAQREVYIQYLSGQGALSFA
ncbi:hypothetical protein [Rodentibacter haemolyticus]|nr:hypothetical protein [Rodentibacter haemolyticus]